MIKDECVFYQQSREYASEERREASKKASLAELAEDAEFNHDPYIMLVLTKIFLSLSSLRTLRLCEKYASF
jgi:hypothetical protein